jgi:hypothetical protein
MTFNGEPPDAKSVPILGTAWVLYASGPIDLDAGKRLNQFLTSQRIPANSYIYLNSPGGSLVGGMNLGRIIRQHNLRTDVGSRNSDRPLGHAVAPGECYSACALAFLGGEFRFLRGDSRYGVHRFAFQKPAPDQADAAQIVSAALIEYIRSMDVDPGLFSLAVSAGKDAIVEPTRHQLEELNVVNNGRARPRWSIESLDDSLYVKGEQDTVYGINKFLLVCTSKRELFLYVIFDAQHREDEIMHFSADSLVIDGRRTRIEHARIERKVKNGWINAIYALNDQYLSMIRNAREVGLAMQPTSDSAYFAGFDSMPFGQGAAKLPGFLAVCGRN